MGVALREKQGRDQMRLIRLFNLIVVATIGVSSKKAEVKGCRKCCNGPRVEGRDYESIGDDCFLWEKRPINWDSARQVCEQEGFQLASITSIGLHNYVAEGMANRRMDNIWIGGIDKEKEGTWKWTDGSPFEFTWWRPGQPDKGKKIVCMSLILESGVWQCGMIGPAQMKEKG